MSVYKRDGSVLSSVYNKNGLELTYAYDKLGNVIHIAGDTPTPEPKPDYSSYSYVQKWASKGISSTQGFDIYDGKVFWVSKSGNSSVPANCYVWNLSDGSQAFDTAYVTVQSGHGNNLSFAYPKLYASHAYPPSSCYINNVSSDLKTYTLDKTLVFDDGSVDCDACIDNTDSTILWTLGHSRSSSDTSAPFAISKWDLTDLTDNGDGTYTPECLQTVYTIQPANSQYLQGFKMHDGLLWYANGYSGSGTGAYVFGVNPNTGEVIYTIDCETTAEPEGVAWVADSDAVGGYALYVGFQGMALRKYTFDALVN